MTHTPQGHRVLLVTNKKHKCFQTRAYGLQATLQYGRKMTEGKAILRS